MKYIKPYKVFESEEYDEIRQTLMLYLQDIVDDDDYDFWSIRIFKLIGDSYCVYIEPASENAINHYEEYHPDEDGIPFKLEYIKAVENAINWMETQGYSSELQFQNYWLGKHYPEDISTGEMTKYNLDYADNFQLMFKKVSSVTESLDENYDIYNFFEELKSCITSEKFDSVRIKSLSDHFVGDGIFDRVVKFVDSIFKSLESVNLEDFKEGMLDFFDEYFELKYRVFLCVLVEVNGRYSGAMGVGKNLDNNKPRIICSILRDMVGPTLTIGHPSKNLRTEGPERLVTDDIYQCKNFDIDNFWIAQWDKHSNSDNSAKYDIEHKRQYKIDHYFDMYKPGIYVTIGDENYSYKMNLKKIESELDVTLNHALHNIDYEEIIWDMSRGSRDDTYVPSSEIYEYTFKVVLK